MSWLNKSTVALLVLIFSLIGTIPASADEEIRVLAVSGDWSAVAHHASSISGPDMCGVSSINKRAIIRADKDGIEFRVLNPNWSLPANVKGQIVLVISGKEIDLDITSNSHNNVSASMTQDITISLLDDMAKASSMTVKAGKEDPATVSLAGSNKVLSVFRTCVGLRGTSGGGSNPF